MKLSKSAFIVFLLSTNGFQPPIYNKNRHNLTRKFKNRLILLESSKDPFNISYRKNKNDIKKINDTEKIDKHLDNLQFKFTLFECILAVMFGSQWNPSFFWKEVRKDAEKIIIYPIIIIFLVFVIYHPQ
tara:strand:+ start:584 stop:970 length:387 start_codon:yes stop_codon:yes gene_type:complete